MMHGHLLVRALFAAVVVYSATFIQPINGPLILNVLLGLFVAAVIVIAESRLREAAVTSLLGGVIGFAAGLALARAIGGALFWADTGSTQVRFLHGLTVVVLPYLGLMFGIRKGEWLEPSKFVSLFQDARPQKRYRILDTSVIIDGRIADIVETGFLDGTLVVAGRGGPGGAQHTAHGAQCVQWATHLTLAVQ